MSPRLYMSPREPYSHREFENQELSSGRSHDAFTLSMYQRRSLPVPDTLPLFVLQEKRNMDHRKQWGISRKRVPGWSRDQRDFTSVCPSPSRGRSSQDRLLGWTPASLRFFAGRFSAGAHESDAHGGPGQRRTLRQEVWNINICKVSFLAQQSHKISAILIVLHTLICVTQQTFLYKGTDKQSRFTYKNTKIKFKLYRG